MNFKLFVLATTMIPSLAYTMEKATINGDTLDKDPFFARLSAQVQDISPRKLCMEDNIHTIVDLGTKIDFNKRTRTLKNWIKHVQAKKSPLFGNTPLFEYHYNEKKLVSTGNIHTISFTQMESLHNGAWLYVSKVRRYYIDQKTYVSMGAFLRIIDGDFAKTQENVVFGNSIAATCAHGINKTDLLRNYYEEYGAIPYLSQKKHTAKHDKKDPKKPDFQGAIGLD